MRSLCELPELLYLIVSDSDRLMVINLISMVILMRPGDALRHDEPALLGQATCKSTLIYLPQVHCKYDIWTEKA